MSTKLTDFLKRFAEWMTYDSESKQRTHIRELVDTTFTPEQKYMFEVLLGNRGEYLSPHEYERYYNLVKKCKCWSCNWIFEQLNRDNYTRKEEE